MMANIVLKAGKSSITMDDTLRRFCAAALEQVAPGVADRLEATCEATIDDAEALWPVASGRSKDALVSEVRLSADAVEGVVLDRVDYTYKIRFAKNTERTRAAEVTKWESKDRPRMAALVQGRPVAPEGFQGKAVWNTLVYRPGLKRGDRLAEQLEGDLARIVAKLER
jgi:hypothetical protein